MPVRANPVSAAGPGAQRPPAPAPAPARPALRITALAAPAASSAAPLPVPFQSSTAAASATAGPLAERPMLVSAIGRRFARREVAGGLPAALSRGPAGAGEVPAAPPVRWRVVDGRLADHAPRRAGAMPRASDVAGNRQTAPALPALRAEAPLPAHRSVPTPERRTAVADRVERPGAAGALELPGLSLRVVPPAEATRRLALGDDSNGPRGQARSAPGEAGARRQLPPAPAQPALDIDMIVDRVQRELKRRERFERERKGLL